MACYYCENRVAAYTCYVCKEGPPTSTTGRKEVMSDRENVPLEQGETESLLEVMRNMLTEQFGVTLKTDYNGASGPAGRTYLTLRFNHFGDHIEVTSVVDRVYSHDAYQAEKAYREEDK